MKNELSYLLWNVFLIASLVLTYFTGVAFPSVIVGVFAGVEIAAWLVVIIFRKSKEVKKAVGTSNLLKAWRIILEAILCFCAFYMGFAKIGCAWVMIVILYTTAAILCKKETRPEENKCE